MKQMKGSRGQYFPEGPELNHRPARSARGVHMRALRSPSLAVLLAKDGPGVAWTAARAITCERFAETPSASDAVLGRGSRPKSELRGGRPATPEVFSRLSLAARPTCFATDG